MGVGGAEAGEMGVVGSVRNAPLSTACSGAARNPGGRGRNSPRGPAPKKWGKRALPQGGLRPLSTRPSGSTRR